MILAGEELKMLFVISYHPFVQCSKGDLKKRDLTKIE